MLERAPLVLVFAAPIARLVRALASVAPNGLADDVGSDGTRVAGD
jgi:hypothetical protein